VPGRFGLTDRLHTTRAIGRRLIGHRAGPRSRSSVRLLFLRAGAQGSNF
jgi:hypothetical protein